MLNLQQILEISILALIFFSIGFFLQKYLVKKEKDAYKKSYKQMIENFLSLNVTHLHDSANLFNLIKNNSKEQNIINFATGSAYHFRSIFNSLKKSILKIREYDPDELNNSSLYRLIEKEEVDLKDLINIELFQLGNFSQIQVEDNTSSQYAFIHGNFELLSKVFLNLVENALKYSDQKIKISLNDENNMFTVRIMSFGKSISENISLRINNKIYDDIKGHGLSSLVDIMNYHDANIHITSLPSEGSSINLEFKKERYAIKKSIDTEPGKQNTLDKPTLALVSAFIVLISSYSLLRINKKEDTKATAIIEVEEQVQVAKLETQAPKTKPKLVISLKQPQNNEISHLSNLIDQETQRLGLDMDL
jgi:signal transduction histidine kinase/preprotein translocase subunit SecG